MAAIQADQHIEADDFSDGHSDYYNDNTASSTQSLNSSILEHVYENGRKYHRKSDGKYFIPSDETEQDRLDMVHHLALMLLGGELCMTKFETDPSNVLDAGCGTGIWALDFGESHPASNIVGVDLMPIQPSWTFPNVRFETDNLMKEWTFKKNYFDFIHCRHITTGVTSWRSFIAQVYEHLTPGGRFELVEHNFKRVNSDDGTLPPTCALQRYAALTFSALTAVGMDIGNEAEDYKRLLEEAGFVDVVVHTFKYPMGPWPKDPTKKKQGAITAETLKTGLEAYGLQLLTRAGGMKEEDVRVLLKETLEDIYDRRKHGYTFQWNIVAKKLE